MRKFSCSFLCLLLSACASHAVRCDRHLRPINGTSAGAAVIAPRGSL
jgi:hypothetical protein